MFFYNSFAAPDGCTGIAVYSDETRTWAISHLLLPSGSAPTADDIRQRAREVALAFNDYTQFNRDEADSSERQTVVGMGGWTRLDDVPDAPASSATPNLDKLKTIWADLFVTANEQGWHAGMATFANDHDVTVPQVRGTITLPDVYRFGRASADIRTLANEVSAPYVSIRWTDLDTLSHDELVAKWASEISVPWTEATAAEAEEQLFADLDEKGSDEQWCEVYTRFAERYGHERTEATRDYLVDGTAEVTITIQVPISTTVTARDADEAVENADFDEQSIDADAIASALDITYAAARNLSWEVGEIEAEDAQLA